MDFEEVERRVLAAPLQELFYRNASGDFVLSNSYTKPSTWSIGHKRAESSSYTWYTARGLQTVVTMIEQQYPGFRSWVVSFEKECRSKGSVIFPIKWPCSRSILWPLVWIVRKFCAFGT